MHSRRQFIQTAIASGLAAELFAANVEIGSADASMESSRRRTGLPSNLVVNDDGENFLKTTDDLTVVDLKRYLADLCRGGVGAIAYNAGDMSSPTFYPTTVGMHYSKVRDNQPPMFRRIFSNLDKLAAEPEGYFGTVFRIVQSQGKKALASFRMNDAHMTALTNPVFSKFWKPYAENALGDEHGYYGNCLSYQSELVRNHFFARIKEFIELYPFIDGVELDGMRSPYFFPTNKGKECAPLMTALVRQVKELLQAQAKRLNRPDYLLTANVPLTPELALECGLDTAAWDAEGLLDYISVGPYQAYMNHPIEHWKEVLKNGTPVFAYIAVQFQEAQYLGLKEYRAAAANAYASGADGIYLFNYPCLLELSLQAPRRLDDSGVQISGRVGQIDFTNTPQVLDELADVEVIRHGNKRFLYCFETVPYRHFQPDKATFDRVEKNSVLKLPFRCFEDYEAASEVLLKFKIEHVARSESFDILLNGKRLDPANYFLTFSSYGRDTRTHTVPLGPYLNYSIPLKPDQLVKGINQLEIRPTELKNDRTGEVRLTEVELIVNYA
jgi:hypothetical protein